MEDKQPHPHSNTHTHTHTALIRELERSSRESHVGQQASKLVLSALMKCWRWVGREKVTEASALELTVRISWPKNVSQFLSYIVGLISLLGMSGIDWKGGNDQFQKKVEKFLGVHIVTITRFRSSQAFCSGKWQVPSWGSTLAFGKMGEILKDQTTQAPLSSVGKPQVSCTTSLYPLGPWPSSTPAQT